MLPGTNPGSFGTERIRAGQPAAGAANRETELHVCGVETLYAAVVDGYADTAPAARAVTGLPIIPTPWSLKTPEHDVDHSDDDRP